MQKPAPCACSMTLHMQASRGSKDSASNGVGEFLQAAFNLASSEDVLEADFSEQSIGQRVTKEGANGHNLQVQHRPSNGSGQGASQPTSGPPTLSQGADDIFWMSQLHGALMQVILLTVSLWCLICTAEVE